MSDVVTVVVVRSLSYTGTTWLNLVLGSHPRAFTLGPPDRVMALAGAGAGAQAGDASSRDACRVHGPGCPFWTAFFERFDGADGPDGDPNFFVALAEHAQRDVIVTNNPLPTGAGRALSHPRVRVRPINFVRDGRAIGASYRRKHPGTSFFDGVRDWLAPSFNTFAFDRDDPDQLCLRYEDVLDAPRDAVDAVGRYLGIDYGPAALAFWDFDHHITAGNAGTIMMIKLAQGLRAPDNENRAFYEERLAAARANPEARFADDRWHDELSARDRFIYDRFCGDRHAELGYERDRFTTTEIRTFERELKLADAPAGTHVPAETSAAPAGSVLAPAAAPAAVPGATPGAAPGLRTQLRPAWIRQHGLTLRPGQVRKVALAGLGVAVVLGVLLVAVVATVTALVAR